MSILKTRFWLTILAAIAFVAPLGAVIAIEYSKNVAKIAEEQKNYAATIAATDAQRAKYYQNIETRKSELQKIMTDAQAQYNTLLQEQSATISAHQKTTTQTVTQPVTVQKVVKQPTSSSSSSSSSKPKTSTSTKTS